MKKRFISILIFISLCILLCACNKKTQENIAMNDGQENTEMNDEQENEAEITEKISEDAFAAGIATEEAPDGAVPEEEKAAEETNAAQEDDTNLTAVINGEIEERCPAALAAVRSGVTYGEYSHGTYHSETCGLERGYCILLPADYSEDRKYPVLYLLHGIFGNEYSFSGDTSNRIREIVGNMAADGIIDETIVVCPNMYATSDPAQQPAFDAESCLPYDNFINDLVNDLMPHIESTYSVLTGRENTYLAGFSMGGRETLFITLKRPELFGYVCAISAAPGIVATKDKFMTHPGQLTEDEVRFAEGAVAPDVLILCCGSRDSVVGTYPKSYHELLETNGTDHIWYEITGADHDNNAIKSGLYNLFKQIGYHEYKK